VPWRHHSRPRAQELDAWLVRCRRLWTAHLGPVERHLDENGDEPKPGCQMRIESDDDRVSSVVPDARPATPAKGVLRALAPYPHIGR
jgi:hypothetical protein